VVTAGTRRRLVLALASCVWAASSHADGVYLGGEIRARIFDDACEPQALSCDRRGDSWGAFAGYRFDPHFGLELGFVDLGEARAIYPRLTGTREVDGSIEGYDLSAILGIPAGKDARFFLRAGGFRWRATTSSSEYAAETEGWSFTAGGGFEWSARRSWQLRLQFLYLDDLGDVDTGETNAVVASLAVSYFIRVRP
jgi:OOP family OmpA-OmpF porin